MFGSNETPPLEDRAYTACVLRLSGSSRESIHDTFTVPSDWSTANHGKNCDAPKLSSFTWTREDHDVPPLVERMTYVLMSAPEVVPVGKSGKATYRVPKKAEAGFRSMSIEPNAFMPRVSCAGGRLLVPKDFRAIVEITAGAVQVAPPSVDFEKTIVSTL